ncbi:MAG: Gfo/Idh/MocA family oxidoreductase [Patescibacteria group bacterium]|nr:Gfo/Idh/MocA family oxidoreductase [Patescibacteria group bacterium]
MKVKVYGAGSIGNHLTQASRRLGWDVSVVDKDTEALRRMKEEIYPMRYGAWDFEIKQYTPENEPKGGFDVIFLGVPPHVRIALAKEVLAENPKVLQLEKPICGPNFEGVEEFLEELKKHPDVKVVNGYEYVLSKFVNGAEEILKSGFLGNHQSMDVEIRERWDGIFGAHPWLSGPQDTYLGFWKKGGGASGEHSHGMNLFQHLACLLNLGKVTEVCANLKYIKDDKVDYDESCFINLTTEKGYIGRVVQDVITFPVKMNARIQGDGGYLECIKGYSKDGDLIKYQKNDEEEKEYFFSKNRPDDFYAEILHINDILEGKVDIKDSPISLERGLETMLIIAAAHKSAQEKRTVKIDYSKGFNLEALS